MKLSFRTGSIFQVGPSEKNGWEYDYVKITFPCQNSNTEEYWVIDAIPCRKNNNGQWETHPDMSYGEPTYTHEFIKRIKY